MPGEEVSVMWHGTVGGYVTNHCRCVDCRKAWTAYHTALRQRHAAEPVPSHIEHGKIHTYRHWGCRCNACTDANTAAAREWRLHRAERALADVDGEEELMSHVLEALGEPGQ